MLEEPLSKSQKKRDAEALQKLGVELISLSVEKLDALPLSAPLKQALLEAKRLKSHGALRRQTQLIGKLMRSSDSGSIANAYAELVADHQAQTDSFHQAEVWRSRLLEEGDGALTELISIFHPEAIQSLRQLIKKARHEQALQQNHGASKMLFRMLRHFIK